MLKYAMKILLYLGSARHRPGYPIQPYICNYFFALAASLFFPVPLPVC